MTCPMVSALGGVVRCDVRAGRGRGRLLSPSEGGKVKGGGRGQVVAEAAPSCIDGGRR